MINCQICNNSFDTILDLSNHIRYIHNMKTKDYYDAYIRQPNEGFCKVCGKPTSYRKLANGYRKYCSNKCCNNDIDYKKRVEETHMRKYGVKHAFQMQKTIENSHTEEANRKRENTIFNHYGVTSTFLSEEIKEKVKKTLKDHYNVDNPMQSDVVKEHIKHKNQEKYGYDWVTQVPQIKDKMKQTFNANYGVDNPFQAEEIKEKSKQSNLNKYGVENPSQNAEIRQKQINSQRKNGTMPKIELYMENILDLNNISYIREYSSKEYPYFCDFFLPNYNIYVEINAFWMHGGHWFNENNPNDLKTLEIWQEKAKTTESYKRAIDIWTNIDAKKRTTAINNRLNYIVLWNRHDIDEFIKNLVI